MGTQLGCWTSPAALQLPPSHHNGCESSIIQAHAQALVSPCVCAARRGVLLPAWLPGAAIGQHAASDRLPVIRLGLDSCRAPPQGTLKVAKSAQRDNIQAPASLACHRLTLQSIKCFWCSGEGPEVLPVRLGLCRVERWLQGVFSFCVLLVAHVSHAHALFEKCNSGLAFRCCRALVTLSCHISTISWPWLPRPAPLPPCT